MLRELFKADTVTEPDCDFTGKFYYELCALLFFEFGTFEDGFLLLMVIGY